jgi:hypothetical protein
VKASKKKLLGSMEESNFNIIKFIHRDYFASYLEVSVEDRRLVCVQESQTL